MEGRLPCPTDEYGIPLVPQDFAECYDVCLNGGKTTNRHHLLFPRREYRGFPERHARESGAMVVGACVCKHSDYHSTYLPPRKPSRNTMCDVAQGDISPVVSNVYIKSKERFNQENQL